VTKTTDNCPSEKHHFTSACSDQHNHHTSGRPAV